MEASSIYVNGRLPPHQHAHNGIGKGAKAQAVIHLQSPIDELHRHRVDQRIGVEL